MKQRRTLQIKRLFVAVEMARGQVIGGKRSVERTRQRREEDGEDAEEDVGRAHAGCFCV